MPSGAQEGQTGAEVVGEVGVGGEKRGLVDGLAATLAGDEIVESLPDAGGGGALPRLTSGTESSK